MWQTLATLQTGYRLLRYYNEINFCYMLLLANIFTVYKNRIRVLCVYPEIFDLHPSDHVSQCQIFETMAGLRCRQRRHVCIVPYTQLLQFIWFPKFDICF